MIGKHLALVVLASLIVADAVPLRAQKEEPGWNETVALHEESLDVDGPLPVVIWHGMGDTCCLPVSMGRVKDMIEKAIPGVYVRSLMIGQNVAEDQYNGFFMPIAKQLDMACDIVTQDLKLKKGFHAVGFSQGGLFLRALVQTCATAHVVNLVSVGGPQQGVFGAPRCVGANNSLCETMRSLLELGAYLPMVQNRVVQAQYWHDSVHHDKYMQGNVFLPLINNEGPKNEEFKKRILALNKFVLVKFLDDTVVVPKDSEWFGFYDEKKALVPLEETALYKEDWIGLQALNEASKLVLMSSPGDHLEMPKGYFEEKIIPFFKEI